MLDTLPYIIPFFAGAVFISTTLSYCITRGTLRRVSLLEARVDALENAPTRSLPPPMSQTPIPSYMSMPPPPYNPNAARPITYFIPTIRASAPI
jgi:hypothetical protein